MKTNYLVFWILASSLFCCQNSTDKAITSKESQRGKSHIQEAPQETKGENYSQEEIDKLINGSLKSEMVIDTFKTLQQFDCGNLVDISNYQITIDTIQKYRSILPELSTELKKLLLSTHCFKKIIDSENYSTYILLTESDTHYSKLAKLVSISKENQEIYKIDLTYYYGNELGEQWISTTFRTTDSFIRKTRIEHNYIHGIGEIDSVEVKTAIFKINKQGKFIKTK